MSERFVSVEVQAPVHQVYTLFTHFNDFPKFMRFVKEVTYYNDQRSHWVVQLAGRHEWDAINEGWIEDRQVGWRSLNGLQNSGRVTFMETAPNLTQVSVFLLFQPPAGVAGKLGEFLAGDRLERELEEDLQRFARMVEEAPPGALDPMSSHFLFHEKSAVATGTATAGQNRSMSGDPMMTPQELEARSERQEQEKEASERAEKESETARQHEAALQEQTRREREAALKRQAELDREEEQRKQAQSAREATEKRDAAEQQDPMLGTLGGRHAAAPETPLGDRDSRRDRFPDYHRGPDAVSPKKALEAGTEIEKTESPWRRAIRGEEPLAEKEDTTQQEQSDSGTAGGTSY
jgi:Polyketide cyclase / dehydrase and lipid transport